MKNPKFYVGECYSEPTQSFEIKEKELDSFYVLSGIFKTRDDAEFALEILSSIFGNKLTTFSMKCHDCCAELAKKMDVMTREEVKESMALFVLGL